MKFHRLDENTLVRYEPKMSSYLVLHKNKLRYLSDSSTVSQLHQAIGFNDNCKSEVGQYATPHNVQIQITRGCNFACSFCYASAVNANNPEVYMSYKNLQKVVDTLFDWGVPNLQYVGGETFIHPNFKQLVEYACNKGLSQTLITNGVIPGLKMEKYRDTIKSFSKIQVSVNAIGKNFDDIVGRNIFDRFKVFLSRIAEECDNTWASFVVTKKSISDIESLFELASVSGLKGIRFGLFAPQGRGASELNIEEYFKIVACANEVIKKMILAYPNVQVESHFNSELNKRGHIKVESGAGVHVLFINKDGNIYPFPLLEEDVFMLGNIFDDDVKSIWEDHPILKELRSDTAIPKVCHDCPTPCPTNSPVMSYLWKGEIGQQLPCLKTGFQLPELVDEK